MPSFSRVTTLGIKNIAQLRTARVGLAIQRYRLATGKLADTLEDLVPTYIDAVPKDPFDGNDLRYRKLETGFVVYSIGEDRSDHGGKERPPKRKGGTEPGNWDVTFIIERQSSQLPKRLAKSSLAGIITHRPANVAKFSQIGK